MFTKPNRKKINQKRHYRLRNKLSGTSERPRLAVYRSGKHIYAQVIDDVAGVTLAAASSIDKELRKELGGTGANLSAAKAVGALVAKRAQSKNVKSVVFDRGGNQYTGRVATLADAAREAGLDF